MCFTNCIRRRSAAARMLRLRVRIPPWAWMFVVSVVCCQEPLRRADHSSRGVLPPVVRHCVGPRSLKNEDVMASFGPQHRIVDRKIN